MIHEPSQPAVALQDPRCVHLQLPEDRVDVLVDSVSHSWSVVCSRFAIGRALGPVTADHMRLLNWLMISLDVISSNDLLSNCSYVRTYLATSYGLMQYSGVIPLCLYGGRLSHLTPIVLGKLQDSE